MKNNYRRKLLIIVCILFIGIFSLTLVYAALNITLNISGSANIEDASWNISISKASNEDMKNFIPENIGIVDENFYLYGSAELIDSGEIVGSDVSNIDVTMTKPGDVVAGVYKITNNGSIPAVYSSINLFDINIESSSNNDSDVEWGRNYVMTTYELGTVEVEYSVGDVVCPGESIFILLGIGIDEAATTIPNNSLLISNFGTNISFIQGDQKLCS